jgi:hypothetical protein
MDNGAVNWQRKQIVMTAHNNKIESFAKFQRVNGQRIIRDTVV